MAFIEVSGPVAFHAVKDKIHPLALEMWGRFRTYAMYFLRYREGQHSPPQVRAAQEQLLGYAVLVEKHLCGKLLTMLLHRAVVHVPEQALAIGPTAWYREEWLERGVRKAKSYTTNHSTRNPALHATNVCLVDMGLQLCKLRQPDIDAHITPDVQARGDGKLDDGDDVHGVCLLGPLVAGDKGGEGDEVRRGRGMPPCASRSTRHLHLRDCLLQRSAPTILCRCILRIACPTYSYQCQNAFAMLGMKCKVACICFAPASSTLHRWILACSSLPASNCDV